MKLVLVTLGKPTRLTGGYLYHWRLSELAPRHGATLQFVSFPELPFPLPTLAGPLVVAGVRAMQPDAILLDSIAAAFMAPFLRFLPRRVPLVGILHQSAGGIDHGSWRTRLQAQADNYVYRHCARLLIASQALRDEFAAAGFPPNQLLVAAPGRDVAESAELPAGDVRQGRRAAFLCVANWVARKDILSLLDAFAMLPPDAATLHLAGDEEAEPDYGARVLSRLERGDLADRVVRHGKLRRDQVAGLYQAVDAFVLPSLSEPYGTVYGEAMACGLPVVGWRAGNLPHLARHEQQGLVLEPGDTASLTCAMLRLAEDESLRRKMGEAAQKRSLDFPTWDDTTRFILRSLAEIS
jgi:glycosyltransferase involved in cell wall biosynthesis